MTIVDVAKHIQGTICTESVTLLRTATQSANEPYQEPATVPTETEHSFRAGVNPMKAKAKTGPGGQESPADWSVFVYIPDFQTRTGITLDLNRLDWLLQCRVKVRGQFCSITHYHVTGPGSIWLTIFAAREQV